MALSFAFDASKGETPSDAARQRQMGYQLVARALGSTPKNVGEGISAIAQAWLARSMVDEARQTDAANRAYDGQQLAGLMGGGDMSGATAAAPSSAGGGVPSIIGGGANVTPEQKALLDTIAGTESPGYNVKYGGARFADFSDHPRDAVAITSGPNAGKTSSAAGRYQFLGSTWDTYKNKLGLPDFSPASQDRAALALAADAYRAKTGGDLNQALASGDPAAIAQVGRSLSGTWTSLPGGIEQGQGTNRFVQSFQQNLMRGGAGADTLLPPELQRPGAPTRDQVFADPQSALQAQPDTAAGVAALRAMPQDQLLNLRPENPAQTSALAARQNVPGAPTPPSEGMLPPNGLAAPTAMPLSQRNTSGPVGSTPNQRVANAWTQFPQPEPNATPLSPIDVVGDAPAQVPLPTPRPGGPAPSIPQQATPVPTPAPAMARPAPAAAPQPAQPNWGVIAGFGPDTSSTPAPAAAPASAAPTPVSPVTRVANALLGQNGQDIQVGQGGGALGGLTPRLSNALRVMSDPRVSEGTRAVAKAIVMQQMQANDPLKQLELQKGQIELRNLQNPEVKIVTAKDGTMYRQARDGSLTLAMPAPAPEKPTDVREYEYYVDQENKAGRTPLPYGDYVLRGKKASAAQFNNNIDNTSTPKLRQSLDENQGKSWSAQLDAGTNSAGALQDLDLLDELSKQAPQGPVTGRLAQFFPGVSSAADAFQSVISRVAPTLRAPGSGATSDIEYEGMVKSLPSLRNKPEANQAIIGMMRAKADLNVQRSEIITRYQNQEISDAEARTQLGALNRKSIMTPQLRALIQATGPSAAPAGKAPEGVDQNVWDHMTPEERKLWD